MRTVVALGALVRVPASIAVGMFVSVGCLVAACPPAQTPSAVVAFVLITAGGGALNDYFDRARDVIDKPWRAIPSGLIAPRTALVFAVILFVAAAVAIATPGTGPAERALLIFTLIAVACYNLVVRYAAVMKAIYVGIVSTAPVAYVLGAGGASELRLGAATAFFVCGRELLMDVLDINGDRVGQSRTVVMRLGERRCALLGFACQAVGVLLFTAWTWDRTLAAFDVTAVTAFIGAVAVWARHPPRRRAVIYGMWLVLVAEVSRILSAM